MHQVHGLRKAFATLSDVMIEEVDHIRTEAKERHEDLTSKLAAQAKAIKAARTELTLLRAESQAGRSALQTKVVGVEEKVEALNDDLTTLTQEVTKGASAQHVMQLDQVELRGIVEEEQRERRSNLEAAEERGANLANRIDSLSHDSRASMQARSLQRCYCATLPSGSLTGMLTRRRSMPTCAACAPMRRSGLARTPRPSTLQRPSCYSARRRGSCWDLPALFSACISAVLSAGDREAVELGQGAAAADRVDTVCERVAHPAAAGRCCCRCRPPLLLLLHRARLLFSRHVARPAPLRHVAGAA